MPTIPQLILKNILKVNEHKKVLARNNCLAKENSSLRDQIRLLKNELMALKANEVNQQLLDSHQVLVFMTFFPIIFIQLNANSFKLLNIKDFGLVLCCTQLSVERIQRNSR